LNFELTMENKNQLKFYLGNKHFNRDDCPIVNMAEGMTSDMAFWINDKEIIMFDTAYLPNTERFNKFKEAASRIHAIKCIPMYPIDQLLSRGLIIWLQSLVQLSGRENIRIWQHEDCKYLDSEEKVILSKDLEIGIENYHDVLRFYNVFQDKVLREALLDYFHMSVEVYDAKNNTVIKLHDVPYGKEYNPQLYHHNRYSSKFLRDLFKPYGSCIHTMAMYETAIDSKSQYKLGIALKDIELNETHFMDIIRMISAFGDKNKSVLLTFGVFSLMKNFTYLYELYYPDVTLTDDDISYLGRIFHRIM